MCVISAEDPSQGPRSLECVSLAGHLAPQVNSAPLRLGMWSRNMAPGAAQRVLSLRETSLAWKNYMQQNLCINLDVHKGVGLM